VVVDVVPQSFAVDPSGTFTIVGIPATATVLKAWFITTAFPSAAENATGTFDGNGLGTKAADDSDAGGGVVLQHYRFDVTSFVPSPGNGSYPYSVTGTSNAFGDALVVVFQDASLPTSRTVINDGAESLLNSTSTTAFDGFGAGPGRLIVFTEADESTGSAESIELNGAAVLGPGNIFNANQGASASLQDIAVTVVNGTNTMDVTTDVDFLGLHLGVLVGPAAPAAPGPLGAPSPLQPPCRWSAG